MSQSERPTADPTTELLYGQVQEYLVFIPTQRACELVAVHAALSLARTWGEFRSRIPQADYDSALQYYADAQTFKEYYAEELKSTPALSRETAQQGYKELSIGDRRPEDDDQFSVEQIPWFFDGDYPE